MAEITEVRSVGAKDGKKVKNAGISNVNQATEESDVVQNPYYGQIDDISLEHIDRNETIEDAVIFQKVQNPYYGDVEDIYLQ